MQMYLSCREHEGNQYDQAREQFGAQEYEGIGVLNKETHRIAIEYTDAVYRAEQLVLQALEKGHEVNKNIEDTPIDIAEYLRLPTFRDPPIIPLWFYSGLPWVEPHWVDADSDDYCSDSFQIAVSGCEREACINDGNVGMVPSGTKGIGRVPFDQLSPSQQRQVQQYGWYVKGMNY